MPSVSHPSQTERAPTLVVLAAGMGSRYGGLKQMESFGPNGERMLDFSVGDAAAAGFSSVIFVIRREFADEFKRSVINRYFGTIETAICFQDIDDLPGGLVAPPEREKPWGTAHAVYAARHSIDGPFAVINADDFYGREAFETIAQELRAYPTDRPALCMAAYTLENTLSEHGGVNRGICKVEHGNLVQILEHTDIRRSSDGIIAGQAPSGERVELAADSPVSMNFWGFSANFIEVIEGILKHFLRDHGSSQKAECYLPAAVDHFIHKDIAPCKVLQTDGKWFGVTYPADKPRVIEAIRQHLASQAQ